MSCESHLPKTQKYICINSFHQTKIKDTPTITILPVFHSLHIAACYGLVLDPSLNGDLSSFLVVECQGQVVGLSQLFLISGVQDI